MDGLEFRRRGREMVDYIVDYLDNIEGRRVTPNIEPGYLQTLIPKEPPNHPEKWEDVMHDVETKIMIGVTHWQHPRFHAYFPAGNSYPSILGDMLGDAIGCVGFSWAASPACTELETIMLDWMGKMIGLPADFLSTPDTSKGGGVIQSSASECVLDCLLAARTQMIRRLRVQFGDELEETALLSKLMAYCSKEAHSCVEKAAMIGFVKLRILEPDEDCRLRGETLRQAMEEDAENGLYPFFVSTTLGTTGCCAFDSLQEIGPICEAFGAWLHVDGAYGGNAFICPEYRYLMRGIEYASSFNMNPNKWMLVNFDCSLMWVKDRFKLTQALVVDPLYLQHSYAESAIDYRHWGIPLSRRFRSLKLWFVVRAYGVSGLQAYVREHCRLARLFERLVRLDARFAVCNAVVVGLVCFRLKASDELNRKLLSTINASGKLHMVPASVNDKYVIRFCVCAQHATEEDIEYAWRTISRMATDVLGRLELLAEDKLAKDELVKARRDTEESNGNVDNNNLDEEDEEKVKASLNPDLVPRLHRQNVVNEGEAATPKKGTLEYKRSCFVRMVSDPKIYNPKIIKHTMELEAEPMDILEEENNGSRQPRSLPTPRLKKRSWISWPLAFILKSGAGQRRGGDEADDTNTNEKTTEKEVQMRFRNLSTRLTISPSASSAQMVNMNNISSLKKIDAIEAEECDEQIMDNDETSVKLLDPLTTPWSGTTLKGTSNEKEDKE